MQGPSWRHRTAQQFMEELLGSWGSEGWAQAAATVSRNRRANSAAV